MRYPLAIIRDSNCTRWIVLFAALKLLFHIWTNDQYGFHRDELATLDDAKHLAWGYVAYPPLTPFLGRVDLLLFGESARAFRFFAALAQALAIILAALMARRLGGDCKAQWIAALCVAISPISLAASALFQYVAFDFFWWALIFYCVVRLAESDDPRWWPAIGAAIGFGVLTKYTAAFFIAGLVAGVLGTNLRRHLKSRWLWIGVAISIAIALPHFVWEAQHDFISLDMLRNIHERDIRIGRTNDFLLDQILISSNPATVPVWIIGLIAIIQSKRFRILAWMVLVPFVLFVFAKARGYYTGPLYPVLFASGSIYIASRRAYVVGMALLLIIGCAIVPVVVPVAPPSSHLFKIVSGINHDFIEELGWPELAREVGRIWNSLPAEERKHAAILCANYGEAGAIDLYGPAYGLPQAISRVNSYWARGYGDPPPTTLIVLGFGRSGLEQRFAEVTVAGRIPNPYRVPNEESEQPEIYLCRGMRVPWPQFWQRRFG